MAIRTNLVTNPSFETNITGLTGGTYMNMSRVASGGQVGDAFGRCQVGSTSASNHIAFMNSVAIPNATVITFSAYLKGISGRAIAIGATSGGSGSVSVTATGSWQRLSYTFTSTGTSANLYFQQAKNGATPYAVGENLDIDGVMLEASASVGAYFDGSTSLAGHTFAWTGTAHGSTSTDTVPNVQGSMLLLF